MLVQFSNVSDTIVRSSCGQEDFPDKAVASFYIAGYHDLDLVILFVAGLTAFAPEVALSRRNAPIFTFAVAFVAEGFKSIPFWKFLSIRLLKSLRICPTIIFNLSFPFPWHLP